MLDPRLTWIIALTLT